MKKQWWEQNFCRSEDCFKHRPSKTPQWVNYFAEFLSPLNSSKLPDLHFNCSTVLNSLCKYVEKDQRPIQKKYFFSPLNPELLSHRHSGLHFTKEEQRKVCSGHTGYFCHACWPHLQHHRCRPLGTKWQHQGCSFTTFKCWVLINRTRDRSKICCASVVVLYCILSDRAFL